MRTLLVAAVITLAASARAGPAPIVGGTPSGETSVVALVRGDSLACSGTVIAPHAVLTAAHCFADSTLPEVVVGDTLAGSRHTAVAAILAPDYDVATLAHDVAILIVDPPLAVAPLPIATTLTVAAGTPMEIIGYGWTVANDPAPARRRAGTTIVDAIEELALRSSGPERTCEGDSGGPAIVNNAIVGLASSGDPACTQFAHHARVDVDASFITDTVAITGPGAANAGDRCRYDGNCAAGACLPALDEPRLAFCTPACASSKCPGELVCIDELCRHRAPSPGADGAPCGGDAECAGELCLAPRGADDTVCTRRCFSDLPGFECPAGLACVTAADGAEACFAPQHDGGCRSGRDVSLLVGLVLVQLLRGRGKP